MIGNIWGEEEVCFYYPTFIVYFDYCQLFNDYYMPVATPSNVQMRSDWLFQNFHEAGIIIPIL